MRWLMGFFRELLRMAKDAAPDDQTQRQANGSSGSDISNSLGPGEFDPDHAISPGYKEDRLGFRSVANVLASSLLTQATRHGLVVSIEGVWGSGKSSLVNLLADELKKVREQSPEIVRFEPWLVGERDGMLTELMSDLASAVEAIEASEKGQGEKVRDEAGQIAKNLREYGSKLSRGAAPIAHLYGALGGPGGALTGKALEAVGNLTDAQGSTKPLPRVKEGLTEGLRKLNRRIVVIVDDLDRLEPQEAAEVLRLIKAVADFPNVIYVLCYDPEIMADALGAALSVDNGTAFLEKVVQVRFKVPQPEAFDLRRWFLDTCLAFHDSLAREQMADDQMQRLQSVCDVEGELLETPRDIVRVMNAVKLYWPPISDKVDYSDLVWLQLVKLENKELYSWIEHYIVEYSALSQGASINEAERISFAKELAKHVTSDIVESPRTYWTLKRFIPGIKLGENIEDKNRLFNVGDEAEISSFEANRRLGSPQHSRYYFAFSKPAGALEDSDLYSFISSAGAGEDLEHLCTALIQEKRPQGGTKFDLLIDRLNRIAETRLPDNAVSPILMALANFMDEASLESGKGDWGVRWPWRSATRLFKKLVVKLIGANRSQIIHEVFASGRAIGWLMSELIRDEIFAHGRHGQRAVPEDDRLFSDEELDEAIGLLLERFKSTDRNRIIDTPEVLNLMYGWLQAGDEAGVVEWVREQQTTDVGFLTLLVACRGWLQSDKTYYPLNRRDLKHFMDFDEALERLKGISENSGRSKDERALAEELLKAAEIGKDN